MVKNPRHALSDEGEERTVVIPVTVESFASFYAREYRALLTLAHALTGDPGDAEDLTQETFLAAFLVWNDIANPEGWVRTAVSNKAMSRWRRVYAARRAMSRVGPGAQTVQEMPAESIAFWAEVRRLPRRQAETVALYYLEDRSVEEISALLGCAPSTTRMHLSRGRRALASRLGADS